MTELTATKQHYMVSIYDAPQLKDSLTFTFVPAGSSPSNHSGEPRRPSPQFIAIVRYDSGKLLIDWSGTHDDPGDARQEIETDITSRMQARMNWFGRIAALVSQVEQWAKEMNWATRRIEKKLDDSFIGRHRVPALVMQEDTCRILLEPLGRSAPGAEGVVDLYLMPAYDDIASLYYYGDRWNLHYMFRGTEAVATMRDAEPVLLSKESLEKVLIEMRQNAA